MEPSQFNRRQIVGQMTVGLAGMTLPTFSFPMLMTTTLPPEKLVDPKTKYPVPPFPGQSQPWPGLASKMDPVPDHGEKSYRGSGRLDRKSVV